MWVGLFKLEIQLNPLAITFNFNTIYTSLSWRARRQLTYQMGAIPTVLDQEETTSTIPKTTVILVQKGTSLNSTARSVGKQETEMEKRLHGRVYLEKRKSRISVAEGQEEGEGAPGSPTGQGKRKVRPLLIAQSTCFCFENDARS